MDAPNHKTPGHVAGERSLGSILRSGSKIPLVLAGLKKQGPGLALEFIPLIAGTRWWNDQ
jgi:hypothetical protein